MCPARYADWPWALGESESLDLDREACRWKEGGVMRGNGKKWREGARGGVKEGNKGLRAEPTAQTRAAPKARGKQDVGCGLWAMRNNQTWLQSAVLLARLRLVAKYAYTLLSAHLTKGLEHCCLDMLSALQGLLEMLSSSD